MKKVLIISPHFPPINAADMHRVRQSLPYFKKFGWQPTILTVFPDHVEMAQDENLQESIPETIPIHKVTAFSTRFTRKVGLGNLGLRAFWQLYKKGNKLFREEKFDLVYFSTTVFASMPLGRLWKEKHGVPFIIDMQDPWRNDFYLDVPKEEQPPKFWFAYRLDKALEGYTIPKADGLIAVSQGYITTLKKRYPSIQNTPSKVLTFGAAEEDFRVVSRLNLSPSVSLDDNKTNIVYVGRGGHDMQSSLSLIFEAFSSQLASNENFRNCKFWFIGTSYALDGEGQKTIEPIAKKFGVEDYIVEVTDRKPYFEVLSLLTKADVIFIPGSTDSNYTASKLYPNMLAKKPLLCVFHSSSSVVQIVQDLNAGRVVLFDRPTAKEDMAQALEETISTLPFVPATKWEKFKPFTAKEMTRSQCDFFDTVISR